MNIHLAVALILGAFVLGYLLFEWSHSGVIDQLNERHESHVASITWDWCESDLRNEERIHMLEQERDQLAAELSEYHRAEFEAAVQVCADAGLLVDLDQN